MDIEPNESWLAGKYPNINAEINTAFPYVAIRDFFAQGEDADMIISEIHQIWLNGELDQEQAIQQWANFNL